MDLWKVLGLGLGGVVVGQAIVFRGLDAWSYLHVRGYIDGLVRGAGSYTAATSELNMWRDHWMEHRSYLQVVIEHLYNYGIARRDELY